jgi:acetyl-CoA carboxylase biotin carboxyl carrier protein
MKPQDIQQLLSFIAESGLEEVIIETEGLKLKTKRNPELKAAQVVSVPSVVTTAPPVSTVQTPTTTPKTEEKTEKPAVNDTTRYIAVKSPMIGTFYRSASPQNPPFVNVGDEIKKGQVVCIIEAMKLFNEIESEFSGRIVKVLLDNASPVEYDQDLFLIEPTN